MTNFDWRGPVRERDKHNQNFNRTHSSDARERIKEQVNVKRKKFIHIFRGMTLQFAENV